MSDIERWEDEGGSIPSDVTAEMESIMDDWFTLDAARRWMDLDDHSWECSHESGVTDDGGVLICPDCGAEAPTSNRTEEP